MAVDRDSRYRGTPEALLPDGSATFLEWRPINLSGSGERLHIVTAGDLDRPDLISYRAYGTTKLWWAICWYNGVADPMTLLVGDRLRIPDRSSVDQAMVRAETDLDADLRLSVTVGGRVPFDSESHEASPLRSLDALNGGASSQVRPYVPPPYRSPYSTALPGASVTSAESDLNFTYAFPIPPTPVGSRLHFQIQVSQDFDFNPVLLGRMTSISQQRWFYYDPAHASGAGGFVPFPANGLLGYALEGQTVYHQLNSADGLVKGAQYFLRHRAVVDQVDQDWVAAPPVQL